MHDLQQPPDPFGRGIVVVGRVDAEQLECDLHTLFVFSGGNDHCVAHECRVNRWLIELGWNVRPHIAERCKSVVPSGRAQRLTASSVYSYPHTRHVDVIVNCCDHVSRSKSCLQTDMRAAAVPRPARDLIKHDIVAVMSPLVFGQLASRCKVLSGASGREDRLRRAAGETRLCQSSSEGARTKAARGGEREERKEGVRPGTDLCWNGAIQEIGLQFSLQPEGSENNSDGLARTSPLIAGTAGGH